MPWLAATAFLHSVMIQEKRGMLKVWNVLLVVLAFGLSLFGTFLTRSGIIQSIHSFTQSSIGAWFLGFICLITAGSLLLIFARLPLLRAKTRLESLVSREATFLYNNLLLVALALTILWGVIYPILSEAVTGQAASVSKPYYNFFLKSFGLPLLVLMGIGPLVAWRRASLRALGRTFVWPLAVSIGAGAGLLALGAGRSPIGVVAYTFSVFVLASIVLEFSRGTAARKALGDLGWLEAFSSLIARNRRRYGGYVVHASIVLLAIGITGSSLYGTTREARLASGQSMTVAGDRLVFRGYETTLESNHRAIRAVVDVYRGDKYLGRYKPGKNQYFAEDQISNEVSIRHDLLTGGDLFLIADQVNTNGTVDLKALQEPLVNLIWFAGLVFIGGSLIALWPDAREQRRLAERYSGATAHV
jgi:cytochrome c-type biogenesis protein CcmF